MRIYLHNWVQLFELYSSYEKYCPSSNATNKLNVVLSFQNLKKINIVYIFFRHIFLYKVIFSISKVSHSLFFFDFSPPFWNLSAFFVSSPDAHFWEVLSPLPTKEGGGNYV